jgi:hypothetical protein
MIATPATEAPIPIPIFAAVDRDDWALELGLA